MKIQHRQIKFLERKEVEQIIAGIKPEGERNLRDRALLEVLFSTGLRISEALALTRSQFPTWTKGPNDIVMPFRKTQDLTITGKGGWQRVVYFSPRSLSAVYAWLDVSEG